MNLHRGSEGPDVEKVQEILTHQGFPCGTIDGDYGKMTEAAVRRFQETHLGPGGKFLVVTGIVGDPTWWALQNPSGKPQKSNILAGVPVGTSKAREAVLLIALHEHAIGVKEVPSGSNWSTEPEGGVAKYATNDSVSGPAAWCMRFAKWVLRRAVERGLLSDTPFRKLQGGGSCRRTRASAEDLNDELPYGVWYDDDGKYIPRPGDLFIMDGHVGLVLRVEVQNGKWTRINTVEGNSGNRVKLGEREEMQILGFINLYRDGDEAPSFEYGIVEAEKVAALSTR